MGYDFIVEFKRNKQFLIFLMYFLLPLKLLPKNEEMNKGDRSTIWG